jgi:hypothetical protein
MGGAYSTHGKGKLWLGNLKTRHRWKGTIKMDLRETGVWEEWTAFISLRIETSCRFL